MPQIAPDLPAVWGIGDPLELRAHVTTHAGEVAGGIAVRFQAGKADTETETTDPAGFATVVCTFSELASIEIGCQLNEPGSTPPVPPIQLRIVDYRQEIVRLFNDFLGRHRSSARLGPGATPRDAEAVLVNKALVSDQAALDVLVSAFEEADYSEHTISRAQFERAWRAWRRLTATPPSAPPPPAQPSEAGVNPETARGKNRSRV
ncbi:MAG: DUF4129 domain-containing protein [Chloroflexi bacterium]|nr:DUF4129 domain-containing protein [Chloroflexota bacterium]